MPTHEGMLFVFEQASTQCFWMRNTLIPLSVAFLADDGTVVNLADMKPQSDDSHCSTKPVRYVLEMNQGWFAKRGVKPGTRISGELVRKVIPGEQSSRSASGATRSCSPLDGVRCLAIVGHLSRRGE